MKLFCTQLGFPVENFPSPCTIRKRKSSQIYSEKSGAMVIIAEMPIISILTGLIACHVELLSVCCSHMLFSLQFFGVKRQSKETSVDNDMSGLPAYLAC